MSHIPALDLPSRSRYSFTDPKRMEGWVSPGPGCKQQLAHDCYGTARSQRDSNRWPSGHWSSSLITRLSRVWSYPQLLGSFMVHCCVGLLGFCKLILINKSYRISNAKLQISDSQEQSLCMIADPCSTAKHIYGPHFLPSTFDTNCGLLSNMIQIYYTFILTSRNQWRKFYRCCQVPDV